MKAFTLIELSIVLVIIGLIVGGILVGRDLITAAAIRAQIAQIDQLQQAVNTFRIKYNNLPGDITDPDATNFGFKPRGAGSGLGDGNGIIQGLVGCGGCTSGFAFFDGENGAFWVDLSTAKLIANTFTLADPASGGVAPVTSTGLKNYIPEAKIRAGSFVYVDSGGPYNGAGADSKNYFGLSGVSAVGTTLAWEMYSSATLTVKEAYSIDAKIDDGMPQSGKVMSFYFNYSAAAYPVWSNGNNDNSTGFPTTAQASSSKTCSDNAGNASKAQTYSLAQNNGVGINCALHFQFQ